MNICISFVQLEIDISHNSCAHQRIHSNNFNRISSERIQMNSRFVRIFWMMIYNLFFTNYILSNTFSSHNIFHEKRNQYKSRQASRQMKRQTRKQTTHIIFFIKTNNHRSKFWIIMIMIMIRTMIMTKTRMMMMIMIARIIVIMMMMM